MTLSAGAKLGPYEVLGPLGAGGMGEVYRARDTRLERTVAIKVLPAQLSSDPVRKQRFEREAKTISGLNHPNICVLHDVGSQDGVDYLVMECVEGETLAKRLEKGPLLLEQVVKYGAQIADALDKAHRSGVVHRDLKPGNIMLTATGAKLLDFGLAKPTAPLTTLATMTATKAESPVTQEGAIVGTFQYMSPEQIEGKEVDGRSDIFSLGAVLYEMLTGQKAFQGKSQLSVASAILEKEPPPINTIKPMTPPALDHTIRRCLAKDPEERWQAARDLALELKWIAESGSQSIALSQGTRGIKKREGLAWAVAVASVLATVIIAALYWRSERQAVAPVMRASLQLAEPLAGVFTANPGSPFALSQDGSRLVFVGAPSGKPSQLYWEQLDTGGATALVGTDDATQPFFSPDGQWVGFFSDGRLRKVALQGGPVNALADAPIPHGANWTSDGSIVYAPSLGSGLLRISSLGGAPQTLTTPDATQRELSHRWPQVLPGNKAVLFTIQLSTQVNYDEARIAVLSLETGKWRTVIEGGSYARYVPSGQIVYAHGGALMAVPFDLLSLQVKGSPAPAQQGVVTSVVTSGGAEYDVADSGLLAYVPGTTRPPERLLAWVDRQGVGKELPAPVNAYVNPRISPDGKMLAVQILGAGEDLWIYDFSRNTLMRLTFGGVGGGSSPPLWTPDGRKVVYRSRTPTLSFRAKPADGSGAEETLFSKELDDPGATPFTVSPDGKTLLFGRRNVTGAVGIYAISLDGSATVQPFLQSAFNQSVPRFSPDGRWVVYESNESGRSEVYVQPYPGPGGKWLISTDGGTYPRWAHSGREIFYRNEDKMMVVPVETLPSFRAGTPRMLFRGLGYVPQGRFDLAPDDQHLLMIREKEAPASLKELSITLNWPEELKRRLPQSTR